MNKSEIRNPKSEIRSSLRLLALLAMLSIFSLPLHAAEGVDALRAAKIATDYLAKQGAGAPHIVSILLDTGTVLNVKRSWIVRWSAPLGSESPREVGLRVKLDGSITRLVEDLQSVSKRAPAAYQIR